jgi:hypothetical protein
MARSRQGDLYSARRDQAPRVAILDAAAGQNLHPESDLGELLVHHQGALVEASLGHRVSGNCQPPDLDHPLLIAD